MKIDLNCDMGEGAGQDARIMPHINSANIACGFHAGGPETMQACVRLAHQHGVSIGAHPGWPDRVGFGRREMTFPTDEIEAILLYQVGALDAIAKAEGANLVHVKPHGAMYNQAASDPQLAEVIARAVKNFRADLVLVGLAGSLLCQAGEALGLRVAHEGFPDRAYTEDGRLAPRGQPGAVIESPQEVALNAVRLVRDEKRAPVDTLCLHGDNKNAAENAILLREVLGSNGIDCAPLISSPR